jgi:uncharacterized small protein (DUF1192 family)
MNAKKNIASIAKKGRGRPPKTEVPKEKNQNLESFEVKAKKKIEDLLGNIELTPQEKKQAETKISKEELGGIDWLSEQVDLLSKENQTLREQLKKVDFENNGEVSELKNKIKMFYNEIHIYFNKWGGKVTLNKKEFSSKFIKLFPFLNEIN